MLEFYLKFPRVTYKVRLVSLARWSKRGKSRQVSRCDTMHKSSVVSDGIQNSPNRFESV